MLKNPETEISLQNTIMRIMKFLVFQTCLCILSTAGFAQEQQPFQITRYQKVFPALVRLSDKVWGQNVPYNDMPVLAYDPQTQEEFLINCSTTPPTDYKITVFTVNTKPVYKKTGKLTLKYPGGRCCKPIGGVPVITMGYGQNFNNEPEEAILQTMLHEGFHYYQYSSLYAAGVYDTTEKWGGEYPRTLDYDKKLVTEAKLLYELTADNSPQKLASDKLEQLASAELLRKAMLSKNTALGEDFQLLTEGTAVYAEMRGIKAIVDGTVDMSGIAPPSFCRSAN